MQDTEQSDESSHTDQCEDLEEGYPTNPCQKGVAGETARSDLSERVGGDGDDLGRSTWSCLVCHQSYPPAVNHSSHWRDCRWEYWT